MARPRGRARHSETRTMHGFYTLDLPKVSTQSIQDVDAADTGVASFFIVHKQGPAHTKKPPWGAVTLRVVWTMKRIDCRLSPGGMKAVLALAGDEVGRLFHNPIQLGIQLGQELDAQLVRQYAARHHMGHLA